MKSEITIWYWLLKFFILFRFIDFQVWFNSNFQVFDFRVHFRLLWSLNISNCLTLQWWCWCWLHIIVKFVNVAAWLTQESIEHQFNLIYFYLLDCIESYIVCSIQTHNQILNSIDIIDWVVIAFISPWTYRKMNKQKIQ